MSSVEKALVESVSVEPPEAAPVAAAEAPEAPMVADSVSPAAAPVASAEPPEAPMVADSDAPGAALVAAAETPEAAVVATAEALEAVKLAAAEAPKPKKTLVLMSEDGAEFEVEESETASSDTISHLIGQGCLDGPVSLPNVSAAGLGLVVDYWKTRSGAPPEAEWSKKLMAMERDDLLEMMLAANYLSDKSLMDLICQTVADTIKHMGVEEVRDYFDVENDLTAEEEESYRNNSLWAFD